MDIHSNITMEKWLQFISGIGVDYSIQVFPWILSMNCLVHQKAIEWGEKGNRFKVQASIGNVLINQGSLKLY